MRTLTTLFAALMLVGCGTLAPDGAYKGDKALYDAHLGIDSAYSIIDRFLEWEHANRDKAPMPQVSAVASKLRKEAPAAFVAAVAICDAYERTRDASDRDAMLTAVATLRQLAAEAMTAMNRQRINL